MSDFPASSPRNDKPTAPIGSGLIDTLIALANRKKLVLGLPLLCAVLAAGFSLLMPNTYRANTKILPPQQAQSGAAALLSQLGGVASAAAGAAGIKNPNDLYIGMLRSRSVMDKVIVRFKLGEAYGTDMMETTRATLEGNTVISSGKDGLINIEVEDTDPKRAVLIANAYADELLSLTKVIAVTEAAQRRLFFERQLQDSKDNLARAEIALKTALDTRGVISVDSQSRAIVETVARLRGQIAAKEIQLTAMTSFVTPQNQDYKRAQQELSSMKAELARQENGAPGADTPLAGGADGQRAGLENIKILRDVKYYQMLYELLAKQYEIARLDESKDSSIVQVLDRAVEPERKYKPRRSIIVISFFLLGLFLAMFIAIMLESIGRGEEARLRPRLQALRNALTNVK